MEQVFTVSSGVVNNTGIVEFIRNSATTFGWEVIDDQISASDYVVIKSDGHDKNNIGIPCYLKCWVSNVDFNIIPCTYWDVDTHIGYNLMSYYTYVSYRNLGTYCDATTYNDVTIKGNKDFLFFKVFRPSTSLTRVTSVYRIDEPTWFNVGCFQTTASGGNDVVVKLAPGELDNFKIGSQYRVCTTLGQIDKVQVTDKSPGTNDITVGTLYYTSASGTVIGGTGFPWFGLGSEYNITPRTALWAPTQSYYSNGLYGNSYQSSQAPIVKGMVSNTAAEDCYNHQETSMFPYLLTEANGTIGASCNLKYVYGTSIATDDKLGINELDNGTISSSTTTTLTDNNKTWEVDYFENMGVIITSGEQEDVTRTIVSNTADTLTVSPEYNPTISGGVSFTICEAFYFKTLTTYINYALIKDI